MICFSLELTWEVIRFQTVLFGAMEFEVVSAYSFSSRGEIAKSQACPGGK